MKKKKNKEKSKEKTCQERGDKKEKTVCYGFRMVKY